MNPILAAVGVNIRWLMRWLNLRGLDARPDAASEPDWDNVLDQLQSF